MAAPHGAYPNVFANSQRPAGKFYEERGVLMNVSVALASKPKFAQRIVQVAKGWRTGEDEIGIHGLIGPAGVQVRAGATRKNRPNACPSESVANRHGDVGQ